ncbi:hypothetical protein CO165_03910 [Candidatus Roizmanbacteria bacterium CG_4_9_14_3_um_filter_33_18]|uniref:Uncharacterized protein n=1 Tax=Candidatus Roizmanbacteria bacterium CG_4_9_14_3_um_filter_33_18 TaxID=1974841 RepID=A0A2M7XXA6_9BACT|nr:MAG: hypothetical protein CO165_03910 [Candidatus Roizmanbacteria bacterium CG_4_9_14_3_um_filter_33_18]
MVAKAGKNPTVSKIDLLQIIKRPKSPVITRYFFVIIKLIFLLRLATQQTNLLIKFCSCEINQTVATLFGLFFYNH